MLYIYLPVLYYHGNLYVTEGVFQAGGVFRCPSGLSCCFENCFDLHNICQGDKVGYNNINGLKLILEYHKGPKRYNTVDF